METLESGKRNKSHALEKTNINGDLNYQFAQLVKLLESSTPDYTTIGKGADPMSELIRFQGSFDLAFPSSDVHSVTQGKSKENEVQIKTNLMNIGGPFGPLPMPYSQLVLERYNRKDRGITQFFNNFQHRIVSLLYRALKHHRPAMDGETVDSEKFAKIALSFLGFRNRELKNRMALPDKAVMGFSSLFLSGSKSIVGLETLLSAYFRQQFKIKPFVGKWNQIPDRFQTKIGINGLNNSLGSTFVVGKRAWSDQSHFVISIQSLTLKRFKEFLPEGSAYKSLQNLVKLYIGEELDVSLELGLKTSEVPQIRLGNASCDPASQTINTIKAPRLGWDCILKASKEALSDSPTTKLALLR